MDTLFNRRKARSQARQTSVSSQDLNEHSVPYDKLGLPSLPPFSVGTVSQGLRGPPNISAPITNPTLTTGGTELNKFALQRSKAERDRAYAKQLNDYAPPSSPSTSTFTADLPAVYSDSIPATSVGRPSHTTPTRHLRSSEASPSSASSSLADFGLIPQQNPSGIFLSSPGTSSRPTSGVNARSETNRGSKYASSVSPEGHSPLSHFHLLNRHGNQDDFKFQRPQNEEEIEALFDKVKRTRGFPDMPNLSIDQKWHMVYNDEQIRWKTPTIADGVPEWYIKKFLDKSITPKQAGSLLVSLRSKEMRYGRNHQLWHYSFSPI